MERKQQSEDSPPWRSQKRPTRTWNESGIVRGMSWASQREGGAKCFSIEILEIIEASQGIVGETEM